METDLQKFKFPFPSRHFGYTNLKNFIYGSSTLNEPVFLLPSQYYLYEALSVTQHFLSKAASQLGGAQSQAKAIAHRHDTLLNNVRKCEENALVALLKDDVATARGWLAKKLEIIGDIAMWQTIKEQSEIIANKYHTLYLQIKQRYQDIIAKFVNYTRVERPTYEADKLLMQLQAYANIPNFAQYSVQFWTFLAPLDFKKLPYLFEK